MVTTVMIWAETDLCLPLVLSVGFQRVLGHNQREVVIHPVAKIVSCVASYA